MNHFYQRLVLLTSTALLVTLPTLSAQVAGSMPSAAASNPDDLKADAAAFPGLINQSLSTRSISEMLRICSEMGAGNTVSPTIVNFDDVEAPSLFLFTEPLKGVHQGVYFQGLDGNGGSILDGFSDFGVAPHSVNNFLAFARPIANIPELMVFGENTSTASLWLAGGSHPGYQIGVIGLGPTGVTSVQTLATPRNWVQVTVSGSPLVGLAIVGMPYELVVDDIKVQ